VVARVVKRKKGRQEGVCCQALLRGGVSCCRVGLLQLHGAAAFVYQCEAVSTDVVSTVVGTAEAVFASTCNHIHRHSTQLAQLIQGNVSEAVCLIWQFDVCGRCGRLGLQTGTDYKSHVILNPCTQRTGAS
jgi:hypothetical protein